AARLRAMRDRREPRRVLRHLAEHLGRLGILARAHRPRRRARRRGALLRQIERREASPPPSFFASLACGRYSAGVASVIMPGSSPPTSDQILTFLGSFRNSVPMTTVM